MTPQRGTRESWAGLWEERRSYNFSDEKGPARAGARKISPSQRVGVGREGTAVLGWNKLAASRAAVVVFDVQHYDLTYVYHEMMTNKVGTIHHLVWMQS